MGVAKVIAWKYMIKSRHVREPHMLCALRILMKTKVTKLDITQAVIAHADSLAQRHTLYVSNFVTRANTELYAILAEIHKLYEQVESSKQRDKLVKKMREHLKSNHNIKTQANTKTTALITKYVTKASRKTAHVYSRVLEVAIDNHIGSAGLVDYIIAKGGIDKVRKAVANAEQSRLAQVVAKQHMTKLTSKLKSRNDLGTILFSNNNKCLPHGMQMEFLSALCKYDHASKSFKVVGIMYPSIAIDDHAMNEYLLVLRVAAISDDHAKFYQACKEIGLNQDTMHQWMRVNNIADAKAAQEILREVTAAQLNNSDMSLKLAA